MIKPFRGITSKHLTGIYFVLPIIIALGILIVFPLIYNFYLSFHRTSIYSFNLQFVGFKNYTGLFSDKHFLNAMNNTFIWTFFSVFFQVLLGLVAALLLQQITYGQRLFQVLIMLPWIIPGIAGALVWRWLYHSDFGVISYFTQMLGFTFSWTGDPKFSLPAVIIVNVWKMYPFAMIMIQAGLKAIPKNLFEAARLDGAGGFRVFYSITLPQLQAVLSVLTLLLIIWAFNSFTFIYQITAGGPARSSEILGLKIYHDALRNMMFGRAAAQAIVLFIMMFIFSVVYMKITYKKEN